VTQVVVVKMTEALSMEEGTQEGGRERGQRETERTI
jgi:hypothetical protein